MLRTTFWIVVLEDMSFVSSDLRVIHDNFRCTQPETVAHYP